jgi:5-methylthioadenosine/S-adenosylhomocysteine deaminase
MLEFIKKDHHRMKTTILGKYLISSAMETPHIGWGAHIEGNRICEIGPNDVLCKKYSDDRLIDATNQIIMPGFVNPHMHMFSVLAQGMPGAKSSGDVIEWLMAHWWMCIEDKANLESIRISTSLCAAMMIRNGITTVCDVMETPYALPGCLDVAGHVIDQAGMRAVLTFEATERVSPENGQLGLEENERFIRQNSANSSRLSGMVCTHTTFTCSLPFLKRARHLADQLGTGLRMHISESGYEPLYCQRTYNKLPFEVYDSIGYLQPDLLASLAIHVKEREVVLAARKGVKIAHIPRASANPGCGVAPIPSYLAHGMTVGLSTYPSFNPFETMRSTQLIHRAHWLDGNLLPAKEVLEMVTSGAAQAIGLTNLGKLEAGYLADLILVDDDFIQPVTENNLIDLLVSQSEGSHVRTVIIDGETVMENYRPLKMDFELVRSEALEASNALWERNGFRTVNG